MTTICQGLPLTVRDLLFVRECGEESAGLAGRVCTGTAKKKTMCRWMAYIGPRMKLSSLVTKPKNGIVQQSLDNVSYTPGLHKNTERNHAVNADGFGISFYDKHQVPHTYRSTKPAWSDTNLNTLADNIETHLTLAHVRAATPGLPVMEANCHPFTFGQLTFMHNGGIGGFEHLKRPMSELFPNEIWHNIQGSTDSEYCFHYFLTHLYKHASMDRKVCPIEMKDALRKAIDGLIDLQKQYCDNDTLSEQSASMNFCVSNGTDVCATRMRRPIHDDSPSLFLGTGDKFEYSEKDGLFHFVNNATSNTGEEHEEGSKKKQRVAIISSEPLTHVEEDWQIVPEETLIAVNRLGEVELSSLL